MKKPEIPLYREGEFDYGTLLKKFSGNQFFEFLKMNDEEYPYYDEWKYKTKDWGISPEQIWSAAKSNRYNAKKISLDASPIYQFKFSTPSIVLEYLHQFDLNLGGSLHSDSIIPEQDKNNYLISSIMEEAIASSQIEGAVTTRKIAKEMLEKSQKPVNRSQQMILNNYNTMKWIVENKHTELTEEILLRLHKMITNDTLDDPDSEGGFRKNDNIKIVDETNEIFYIPPGHKEIKMLIGQFLKIANDKDKQQGFIHPILKGILLHFLIGYIHPFIDGNGRTARALFYWYLISKGYWLVEYMSVSRIILKAKTQYAKAYLHTEYDENDLTYFFIYNLKCISKSLEELRLYIERKVSEKNTTIRMLSNHNLNERQVIVLQDLLKDPNQYYTVRQVETKFSVSNQTARTDLIKMVDMGFLIQRNIGKTMTFFATEDLPKKINNNRKSKV